MGLLIEYLKMLSFPRRTGSEGNRRICEWIEKEWSGLGLAPEIQDFAASLSSVRGLTLAFSLFIFLLSAGALVAVYRSLWEVAALLSLTAAAAPLASSFWSFLLERFLADFGRWRTSSRNLLARIPGNPGTRTVIVMAHHDSKSQRIPLVARVIAATCALLWLDFFCFILLLQLFLRSFAASSLTALGWANLLATAFLLFGALLFDEGNRSPGAQDNGTGVAVLLGLARRLAQDPPSSNVWLVATGAEEEGLQGSIHFARKYAPELPADRTFVLNLDMVGGSGPILILDRYGIPPRGAGQALARELEKRCRGKGVGCSRIWLALGAGVDHLPFDIRGYESVTISRGKLLTDFRTIHSTRDTWETVDEKSMEEVLALVTDFCS